MDIRLLNDRGVRAVVKAGKGERIDWECGDGSVMIRTIEIQPIDNSA